MRRFLIVFLVVALIVTVAGHYAALMSRSEPAFTGNLRIAFASSLTGPGQAGALEMLRAAQAKVDEVNATGGVNGSKVELVPFDDANDAVKAREVAVAIAADTSIVAVIGHNYSSASLAAGPVYAAAGIAAVTPASTHPDVTKGNPWYYRSIFSDTTQGEFLARYAREALNAKPVAVLATSDPYARQIAQSFVKAADGVGLEVLAQWWVDAKAADFETAVEAAITVLRALPKETVLLMPAYIDPAVKMLRKLRDAGLTNRVLGPDSLGSARFAQAFSGFAREQARPGFYSDGVFVSVPFLTDTGSKEARRLIERLEATGGPLKTWGAPFAYDAAKLIITAAQRAQIGSSGITGPEARVAVHNQLEAMHSRAAALTGATGTLQFGAENTPSKPLTIGQFSGRLISSLIQLTFDRDADDQSGIVRLRKTPVVYTGIILDTIDAIDLTTSSARLSFDLWFRFQGSPPVNDIVFVNAIDPVKLGDPVESARVEDVEYRLYRVTGRFKMNFEDHRPPPGNLMAGIQFIHRTLSRDQLIYVVDPSSRPTEGSSQVRPQVVSSDWRVIRNDVTADIVDRLTKGNPLQTKTGEDRRSFSNFIYRVELGPRELGLRRQLTGETVVWAEVVSTLALIACLILDGGGKKRRWARAWLVLTGLVGGLFLITSESAIFDTVSSAGIEWAQTLVITAYDLLWWLVAGVMVNMAIRRFAWEPLEQTSGRRVPQVIQNFASTIIYFVTFFGIFANVLQKDITGLVATSGVLAMILGLALQGNLSNIFSGIVLNLEQPFRPGDWVKIGDAPMGKIIDISWRAMKVQTFSNSVLSIPNTLAASSRIENCSYPNNRYFIFQILYFDSHYDPIRITGLLNDALKLTECVDGRRRLDLIWVKFNGVTEQGLKFLVAFDVNDRAVMNSQEHAVLTSIARVFKSAGLSLARYVYHRDQMPCEAALAAADVVGDLPSEVREVLSAKAIMRRFEPGDVILQQGEAVSALYVLVEGVVAANIAAPNNGTEREVERFGPGDYLGEALVCDEPQPVTLRATGPVIVYELPAEAVRSVLVDHPPFAQHLRTLHLDRRALFQLAESMNSTGTQKAASEETPSRLLAGLKALFKGSWPTGDPESF